MNSTVRLVVVALVFCCGYATNVAAQDEKAAMEAMMKAAAPGMQHQFLAKMAGSWRVQAKMWMAPNAPVQESRGTSINRMILGGRYLQQDYKATMNGMAFAGMGLNGFDNTTQKFVGTWSDSWSTGIMYVSGDMDASGKAITMTGEYVDPMTKATTRVRTVTRVIDNNKHVFEYYAPAPDGAEMKMMEITYTRMQRRR
jgi:hypothetical protein